MAATARTRVDGGRWRKWQVVKSRRIEPAELPHGYVVTTSGRVSGVTEPGEVSVHYPFPVNDLVAPRRCAEVRLARSQGPLRGVHRRPGRRHRRDRAREILAEVPTPNNAVLLAVSPNQKAIEVVYGAELQGRGIEESAPLGATAARRPSRRAT